MPTQEVAYWFSIGVFRPTFDNWPILKVQMKVMHISTPNISSKVVDRTNIINPIE